jgi:hypothetical protein
VDDFVRVQVVQRRDHLLRYVLALELAHGAVFFFLKATTDKFTTLYILQHTEIIRFAMFWQLQLALAAVFFFVALKKHKKKKTPTAAFVQGERICMHMLSHAHALSFPSPPPLPPPLRSHTHAACTLTGLENLKELALRKLWQQFWKISALLYLTYTVAFTSLSECVAGDEAELVGRLKRIEQQNNVRVVQPPLDVDFLRTGRERRVIVDHSKLKTK